jgi:hypothetical protein
MINEQDSKPISVPQSRKMLPYNVPAPHVPMCAWCQRINDEGFENFSKGVNPMILKELKIVDFRVKRESSRKPKRIAFSHGICGLHNKQVWAELGQVPKPTANSIPCLITDHALRRQYMKGLFTPEQVLQAKQQQTALRERLQKLANIKK